MRQHENRYAVAGGTGAYANADGWVSETWDPALERFVLTVHLVP